MKLFIFSVIITLTNCAGACNKYPDQNMAKFIENLGDPPPFYPTYEIIEKDGYLAENHYVTTSDGYILNLHRIPCGKSGQTNGKVVFLQHGLLSGSHDWVIPGPEKGLGYILADEGYDVWLGNARGNTYSRNHTTLDPDKDSAFWQFSWHQIGIIDLPTMIDYILKQTEVESVYYSGHSQGTTTFYVMVSSKPEYNAKIKTYVHLAPAVYMNHMTSPLPRIISFFEDTVEELTKLIGLNEVLPHGGFVSKLTAHICSGGIGEVLCKNILFAFFGFSNAEMNDTLLPTIMVHVPAGCSAKQVLHYGQEIKSGYFRQYDFGKSQNKEIYGQDTPPDYDLTNITARGYLIYAHNDWMVAEVDVVRLAEGLGDNCLGKILVPEKNFNHLDFVYGINAPYLVYYQVVEIFAKS